MVLKAFRIFISIIIALLLIPLLLIHGVRYRKLNGIQLIVLPLVFDPSRSYSSIILLLSILKTISLHRLERLIILDVGCGSGFLSIPLGKFAKYVVAVDIDDRSIINTLINCKINGLDLKMDIVKAAGCSAFRDQSFDFIVTNPPYIPCPYISLLKSICCGVNYKVLRNMVNLCIRKSKSGIYFTLSSMTFRNKGDLTRYRVLCTRTPIDEICSYLLKA